MQNLEIDIGMAIFMVSAHSKAMHERLAWVCNLLMREKEEGDGLRLLKSLVVKETSFVMYYFPHADYEENERREIAQI